MLLQGVGHDSPRDAGQLIARLKREAGAGVHHVAGVGVHLGEHLVGHLGEAITIEQLTRALARFLENEA